MFLWGRKVWLSCQSLQNHTLLITLLITLQYLQITHEKCACKCEKVWFFESHFYHTFNVITHLFLHGWCMVSVTYFELSAVIWYILLIFSRSKWCQVASMHNSFWGSQNQFNSQMWFGCRARQQGFKNVLLIVMLQHF